MKPTKMFRYLVRWHRWVGLAATLFIVWLVITGVFIHHAADFGLTDSPVQSAWILDRYGIGEPEIRSFKVAEHWVSQAGKSLYLDGKRIAGLGGPVVGAASLSELLAIASRERLLVVDPSGQLIEDLRPEHGLPTGIHSIGNRGERIVLETSSGLFEADREAMQWRPVRGALPRSAPVDPPVELRTAIAQDARSREISRERFLRDLHSGGFFGAAGRWAIDLAAFALLVLVTTGIWIWWRARREFGTAKTTHADKARGQLSR